MISKTIHRGDIVLVPFPFTDLSGAKVRPAVIISPDPQETDVLLAFISSVIPSGPVAATDFLLESFAPDFRPTGLKTTSVFKRKKITTIEGSRLGRMIGKITPATQAQLDSRLLLAIGLSSNC